MRAAARAPGTERSFRNFAQREGMCVSRRLRREEGVWLRELAVAGEKPSECG